MRIIRVDTEDCIHTMTAETMISGMAHTVIRSTCRSIVQSDEVTHSSDPEEEGDGAVQLIAVLLQICEAPTRHIQDLDSCQ